MQLTQFSSNIGNINIRLRLLFIISLLLYILTGHLFIYIGNVFFPDQKATAFDADDSAYFVFVMACIVAPLLETFLFQVLPNVVLTKAGIENFYILLCVPAALFGLAHSYDTLSIMHTCFGGLILNNLYLVYKRDFRQPFLYVALLHSLYNLYGFLFIEK